MPDTSSPIIISSDHAGFKMKEFVKSELDSMNIAYDDVGTHSEESTDYPVSAARVGHAVGSGRYKRGITICGSGIGASMSANRIAGCRAALCVTTEMAELSRRHNDANVLVLGGRITPRETAAQILRTWLSTPFDGDRHIRRVALIDEVGRGDRRGRGDAQ